MARNSDDYRFKFYSQTYEIEVEILTQRTKKFTERRSQVRCRSDNGEIEKVYSSVACKTTNQRNTLCDK